MKICVGAKRGADGYLLKDMGRRTYSKALQQQAAAGEMVSGGAASTGGQPAGRAYHRSRCSATHPSATMQTIARDALK